MGVRRFEDLEVWGKAINLAVAVYETTSEFPKSEQFGITNQLRRCSSSVSANIAEGFGRTTIKDKLQFYAIAHGSLLETKSFIYLATKLGFVKDDALLQQKINETQRLLSGFIKSTKQRLNA